MIYVQVFDTEDGLDSISQVYHVSTYRITPDKPQDGSIISFGFNDIEMTIPDIVRVTCHELEKTRHGSFTAIANVLINPMVSLVINVNKEHEFINTSTTNYDI